MNTQIETHFLHVAKTDQLKELINRKVEKLEQVCSHMTRCRISIDQPQTHQRRGNPYRVLIDMHVPPGHEVVVKRESSGGDMHDPLPKVLNDAFQAARRSLQKLVRQQRREVKSHPAQETLGRISRIFTGEDYGFFITHEGREIYFHRNSVLNGGFNELKEGSLVRFVEEDGEKGPQASTVELISRE